MKVIATNKRAHFEYFVLEKFSAGLSLVGAEVKSIRSGHASINDTYIIVRDGEAFIINMYIKTYPYAQNFVPDERRSRKLLLHKSEIARLSEAIAQKGLTVVPLKLYFERSLVKVELAICKGKKLHDKRDTIKKRDLQREVQREIKMAR
ncbi:MAG: SsrA-binding protein SmpB [Opitutales bacterium]|nr:SsrA-binding protein SmpB [Opitutales bacterium]